MTQAERITKLLQESQQRAIDGGTRVRCPKCNAGIGKFCRSTDGTAIIHVERVALQRETLGDLQPDAIYA